LIPPSLSEQQETYDSEEEVIFDHVDEEDDSGPVSEQQEAYDSEDYEDDSFASSSYEVESFADSGDSNEEYTLSGDENKSVDSFDLFGDDEIKSVDSVDLFGDDEIESVDSGSEFDWIDVLIQGSKPTEPWNWEVDRGNTELETIPE
jgi:hypothetical protein